MCGWWSSKWIDFILDLKENKVRSDIEEWVVIEVRRSMEWGWDNKGGVGCK